MTRQLLLSGLLVIGALQSPTDRTTFAVLTTSVQSTANQFSAGTLHIANGLAAGSTLSVGDLLAGDHFDAQLNVTNSGSLDLTYAMTTTTSGSAALASALELTVRAKTSNPCASRDGGVLYSGTLAGASIGNVAHGVQAGDRQLAPAASESLCFTVLLPATASASLHDTDVVATFAFSAEQS
jgi:hypothetical protein